MAKERTARRWRALQGLGTEWQVAAGAQGEALACTGVDRTGESRQDRMAAQTSAWQRKAGQWQDRAATERTASGWNAPEGQGRTATARNARQWTARHWSGRPAFSLVHGVAHGKISKNEKRSKSNAIAQTRRLPVQETT